MRYIPLFLAFFMIVTAIVANSDMREENTRHQMVEEKKAIEEWLAGFDAATRGEKKDEKRTKSWSEGYDAYKLTHNHASTDDVVYNQKRRQLETIQAQLDGELGKDIVD